MTKKIAVTTGGGDTPGMNAVIHAIARAGIEKGWEVYGIKRGYQGLMWPEGTGLIKLDRDRIAGIAHQAGTILGTNNRQNPWEFIDPDTQQEVNDIRPIIEKLNTFDGVVAIGGDGTMGFAHELSTHGVKIVGVPKTIDNDLKHTDYTFGFNTAVETAVDALGKVYPTAESHRRVMVVEVMGRNAGWIALYAGIAASVEVILIPEITQKIDERTAHSVWQAICHREQRGKHFSVVVVAEGIERDANDRVISGRASALLAEKIEQYAAQAIQEGLIRDKTDKLEARSLVLGHLQRGGQPTAFDRVLAARFGVAAVNELAAGRHGYMLRIKEEKITTVALQEVAGSQRKVPLDSDVLKTARDMGICLGD